MFGSIGSMEILLIFVVALLLFGPRKLPELGRSLGKGIAQFRKASQDLQTTLDEEVRAEERQENAKMLTPPNEAARPVAPSAGDSIPKAGEGSPSPKPEPPDDSTGP